MHQQPLIQSFGPNFKSMAALPTLKSFIDVSSDSDFPIQNLPYGVFSDPKNTKPRIGVAIGDWILDLSVIADAGFFETIHPQVTSWFHQASLNVFMAQGPLQWQAVRKHLLTLLSEDCPKLRDASSLRQTAFVAQQQARYYLPFNTKNYTDFYSGIHHAENVGRLFRDKNNPLLPNYRHIPVAYHGRASSLVISGTPIRRPMGQFMPQDHDMPQFGPSQRLDFELELGTVIGTGNLLGEPIAIDDANTHIFGFVLVNDWSARDIQQWEYVPLGPFLGKSFATTLSPWVVTQEALAPFQIPAPQMTPPPLPYLVAKHDFAYDIQLQVSLITRESSKKYTISHTNTQALYWTQAQQIAHLMAVI